MAISESAFVRSAAARPPNERGWAMATQSTIVQQLSKALHVRFHAIPQEPLPQRWVELIHHLNEQERISEKERRDNRPERK